ncbi:MAG TPA: LLM class flavin-dependent oxidoreductase [Stellaceae bacterium]|nr:LLM class flavin-dependent oxidoreductase [Stellaceae bacterium]
MSDPTLRSGIFLAPFHPTEEDPTLAIRRDLELVEWLDRLGYEEAWIGEHHSAGFEIISSPEVFIAAAAERTKRIKLGTGVVSLPYHNPLMAANRIIQLDHMTMGRVMFGAGPGLLASDAMMLGIQPIQQRDRMMEALDVILRLFRGETVTETRDWYTLKDAKVHLLPFTKPYPEVCVASTVTPSGGRAAGKYDLGMLCVAATQPDGFDALGVNWNTAQEIAAEHGRKMDPARLRLVGPMHIAETREEARRNANFGFYKWFDYFQRINPARFASLPKGDPLDILIAGGAIVCGTPEDAIKQIDRLYAKQGQFGAFLQLAHNWVNWDATKKSYELYARYVVPHFRKANRHRVESLEWTTAHNQELVAMAQQAQQAMFAKHKAEREEKEKAKGRAAE